MIKGEKNEKKCVGSNIGSSTCSTHICSTTKTEKNIKHTPKQAVKKDIKQQPIESVREINVEPTPVIEPGLQHNNPNENLKNNQTHNIKKPVKK